MEVIHRRELSTQHSLPVCLQWATRKGLRAALDLFLLQESSSEPFEPHYLLAPLQKIHYFLGVKSISRAEFGNHIHDVLCRRGRMALLSAEVCTQGRLMHSCLQHPKLSSAIQGSCEIKGQAAGGHCSSNM